MVVTVLDVSVPQDIVGAGCKYRRARVASHGEIVDGHVSVLQAFWSQVEREVG